MLWNITLSPQRSPLPFLEVSVEGSTITLCGEILDLSPLGDGELISSEFVDSDYLVGPITREGDVFYLTLIFPLGVNPSEEAKFPEVILQTSDGSIELPYAGEVFQNETNES